MHGKLTSELLCVVPSESHPGKAYAITRGKDGVVYCSCNKWKFQKLPPRLRTCPHLQKWRVS